jgi:hypothetical protein
MIKFVDTPNHLHIGEELPFKPLNLIEVIDIICEEIG